MKNGKKLELIRYFLKEMSKPLKKAIDQLNKNSEFKSEISAMNCVLPFKRSASTSDFMKLRKNLDLWISSLEESPSDSCLLRGVFLLECTRVMLFKNWTKALKNPKTSENETKSIVYAMVYYFFHFSRYICWLDNECSETAAFHKVVEKDGDEDCRNNIIAAIFKISQTCMNVIIQLFPDFIQGETFSQSIIKSMKDIKREYSKDISQITGMLENDIPNVFQDVKKGKESSDVKKFVDETVNALKKETKEILEKVRKSGIVVSFAKEITMFTRCMIYRRDDFCNLYARIEQPKLGATKIAKEKREGLNKLITAEHERIDKSRLSLVGTGNISMTKLVFHEAEKEWKPKYITQDETELELGCQPKIDSEGQCSSSKSPEPVGVTACVHEEPVINSSSYDAKYTKNSKSLPSMFKKRKSLRPRSLSFFGKSECQHDSNQKVLSSNESEKPQNKKNLVRSNSLSQAEKRKGAISDVLQSSPKSTEQMPANGVESSGSMLPLEPYHRGWHSLPFRGKKKISNNLELKSVLRSERRNVLGGKEYGGLDFASQTLISEGEYVSFDQFDDLCIEQFPITCLSAENTLNQSAWVLQGGKNANYNELNGEEFERLVKPIPSPSSPRNQKYATMVNDLGDYECGTFPRVDLSSNASNQSKWISQDGKNAKCNELNGEEFEKSGSPIPSPSSPRNQKYATMPFKKFDESGLKSFKKANPANDGVSPGWVLLSYSECCKESNHSENDSLPSLELTQVNSNLRSRSLGGGKGV